MGTMRRGNILAAMLEVQVGKEVHPSRGHCSEKLLDGRIELEVSSELCVN